MRCVRSIALWIMLTLAVLGLAPLAHGAAVGGDLLRSQLAEAQSAQAAARQQSAEAGRRAERMAARASAAQDAAERDRAALAALGLRIQAAEADLAATRAQLRVVQTLESAQARRLAAQQRPLTELVASLQLLTRRPPISLFAQPGATRDMIHSRALIEAVLPQVRQRTQSLRAELAQSRRLRSARRVVLADVEARSAQLGERRTELARSAAQSRARAAALGSGAGLENDRAIALAQDAGDIGDLLTRLEDGARLRDRLIAYAGPVPRPGTVADGGRPAVAPAPVGQARPAYVLPVVGTVMRGLGEVDAVGTRARGLTIATGSGAQIVAPADGRVVYAGLFRSFGRIVIIDHGGGWTSLVTNMVAVSTRVGDMVSQGSPIGRAGPDHPRITVELRRSGQPMDIATLVL